jgi:hypothetical protein
MEELRDRARAFVRERKVVSIEEQMWLRLMDQALDEATMLDFTFRLMNCAHKENGVFGEYATSSSSGKQKPTGPGCWSGRTRTRIGPHDEWIRQRPR